MDFSPTIEDTPGIFGDPTWNDVSSRNLAGGSTVSIDYTVMAMAVLTLIFLLVVEILRHMVDRWAHGKEFFETMLQCVYRELSTLGIVEAGVFLAVKYYEKLNLKQEQIFAEVHFTIFFVAIINAVQSVFLYLLANQIAQNRWVKMEKIDIDHYVSIRQEFERIDTQLRAKMERAHSSSTLELFGSGSWKEMWEGFIDLIHYPVLKRKHTQLLVQVRFHELRVHFIEDNELPAKFKVSNYLLRSLNNVFKKLVHISTVSWLGLMAAVNLLYFLMGIVANLTRNSSAVGDTMTGIFLGYNISFVLLSFVVLSKMKQVYYKIMKDEKWTTTRHLRREQNIHQGIYGKSEKKVIRMSTRDSISTSGVVADPDHQLNYFWGGDPHYIVNAAQLMQFGYAIAFAIVLVFKTSLDVDPIPFDNWFPYFGVPLICYGIFLWIWSYIIPQYTQCTSLGELVHQSRLIEAKAQFNLEEAKRKRQAALDVIEVGTENHHRKIKTAKKTKIAQKISNRDTKKSEDEGSSTSDRLQKITELTSRSTSDLPQFPPRLRSSQRRARMRSLSDGVSAMRLFSSTSDAASRILSDVDDIKSSDHKVSRRNENKPLNKSSTYASKVLSDVDDMKSSVFKVSKRNEKESLKQSRRNRRKTLSEGVELMQSRAFLSSEKNDSMEKDGNANFGEGSKYSHSSRRGPFDSVLEDIPARNVQYFEEDANLSTKDLSALNKDINKSTRDSLSIPEPFSKDNISLQDENTVDSAESVASLSDCDDVPDINKEAAIEGEAIIEKFLKFFLSGKYQRTSSVLITMVVFYVVSMRIEVLLIDSCALVDLKNTWDLERPYLFWVEFFLLCFFISISSVVCIIFSMYKRNPSLIIAGAFDILLSSTCLGLLIWAEVQRCCDCGHSRLLAESEDCLCSHSRLLGEVEDNKTSCSNYIECCPTFGSRICGGVGSIEPFTSVIALRVIRFWLGNKLHNYYRKFSSAEDESNKDNDQNNQADSLYSNRHVVPPLMLGSITVHDSTHSLSHHNSAAHSLSYNNSTEHGSFDTKTGTMVSLWQLALVQYPLIVEKYGMFSSELLEAMLGIDPYPDGSKPKQENQNIGTTFKKINKNPDGTLEAFDTLGNLNSNVVRSGLKTKPNLELDQSTQEAEISDLINPEAPLIRSMRRCQYKFPPLIMEWKVVDVIMTKHEIVILDVSDEKEEFGEGKSIIMKSLKDIIVSTKGGKDIPLRDVYLAHGGQIIGRLTLKEIDKVKVDRIHANSASSKQNVTENFEPPYEHDEEGGLGNCNRVKMAEYWQDENNLAVDGPTYPDESHWECVTEDRLRIHTVEGTIFFRFFVDLCKEDGKNIVDPEESKFEKKQGALLWCQTIAHLCGRNQLHQDLTHFGEDRDKELADFVNIIERQNENNQRRMGFNKMKSIKMKSFAFSKPL